MATATEIDESTFTGLYSEGFEAGSLNLSDKERKEALALIRGETPGQTSAKEAEHRPAKRRESD